MIASHAISAAILMKENKTIGNVSASSDDADEEGQHEKGTKVQSRLPWHARLIKACG